MLPTEDVKLWEILLLLATQVDYEQVLPVSVITQEPEFFETEKTAQRRVWQVTLPHFNDNTYVETDFEWTY